MERVPVNVICLVKGTMYHVYMFIPAWLEEVIGQQLSAQNLVGACQSLYYSSSPVTENGIDGTLVIGRVDQAFVRAAQSE